MIDGFNANGQPVGSKALAADPDVQAGASTIRNELAVLEEQGLLAHPHTSAGRVPTDAGYRYFVDRLLPARREERPELQLSLVRREVDEAMRVTTETLSQVTNLLAIVSAPPIATTTLRHVEVLPLQPQVLMVVVITSTGGVSKRVFTFDRPVDPGLADWASAYLNEELAGMGIGSRMLQAKFNDPGLQPRERAFIAQLAPAFTELAMTAENTLYVDGAARLLSEHRFQDVSQLNELLDALERRVSLLGLLSRALDERDIYVRIGGENEMPALRSLSLVAGNYGLPQRNLGTVSVIGPMRMDYARAIITVREAAQQLSRFVEDIYEYDATRLLRGARRPARRRRGGGQEGVPAAGARAAPGRQRPRPRRRGQVQGGGGGLRGAVGPRPPAAVRRLRPRGPAERRLRPELRRLRVDLRPLLGLLRRRRLRRRVRRRPRARRAGAGRRRGGRRADLARGGRARQAGRGRLRRPRALPHLQRQRRQARHADRDVPALPGLGPAPGRLAHRLRPARPLGHLRHLRRRRPHRRASRARSAAATA